MFESSVFSGDRFSFLFLGDLHYRHPLYKTAELVKDIAKDIKSKGYKIDFVCNIGDLIENQKGSSPLSLTEGAEEWEFAIANINENFKVPFFMALGNHDWYGDTWFGGKKNIEKYYFPFMAKQLGRSLNGKPFFSFHWGNSYFLFTNHVGFDAGWDKEQRIWLKKSLDYAEGNSAIKHVFIFGHPNLWNVDYFRFNEQHELLDIISKYKKAEVYFCGHTHHNNATVWKFKNECKLLQINGSPKGHKNSQPELLGEKELVLNPPPSERGYANGIKYAKGYFIVSVDGPEVTVSFDMIRGGRIWEFCWKKPGEIKEKVMKIKKPAHALNKKMLKDIKEARLFIYPYVPHVFLPKAKSLKVLFNGLCIGDLPRNSASWHMGKSSLKIPPDIVKLSNQVSIENPNNELFAIRDCYILVVLKDGGKVITPVYPYVLFSGNWEDLYMDFGLSHPDKGVLHSSVEMNVPEELIKSFCLGERIDFKLEFIEKIEK
jgi:predicted MPP superfamily phosphohydrolase